MPRKMDFEAKYRAGDAMPFNQKNDMFKRMWWDKKFEGHLRDFNGVIPADGRNGAINENLALRNAAWSIEQGYAKGVSGGQFLMFDWNNDYVIRGMARIDRDTPFDASDPAHNSRVIKKAAEFFGAVSTGVCKFDQRWIYTKGYRLNECVEFDIDIPDEYQYVINFAVEMPYEHARFLPTYLGSAGTGYGYSKMAVTAGLVAQFIRQLGYKAIPSGNDTAMSIPYAIQAGLGELGRNGILVTPKYGPRVRLCKIFTNMPLECDEPIEFGVMEFCNVCKRCAEQCPSKAITEGERTTEGHNISNSNGPLKWYVDGEKCHMFWTKSRCDCGICIRACPFNKPLDFLHETTRWFIERFPALDSLVLQAEKLFGYGKQVSIEGYWDS
ncbi:MAG: reductive dehalogenase [Deltaproteobacteria bacterium]|nr:reductive dehalogenase [Deltaproteobacteria bacterium]MBW2123509.1 reductive dehalogenase [Deltaproteobacteria bacterium]